MSQSPLVHPRPIVIVTNSFMVRHPEKYDGRPRSGFTPIG